MNRNLGASFSLSVLTVLTFAVILYQPDTVPTDPLVQGETADSPVEIVEARPPVPEGEGEPAAVTPVEPPALSPIDAAPLPPWPDETNPTASSPSPPEAERLTRPSPEPPRSSQVAADAIRREPRSAFTQVLAGESLADLAKRVYGSTDELEALWRANRDTLDHIESPIPEGAMLRTP
ncbi:MAG: hypothetical protein AB7I30_03060 [Isosphaeraceae bacterium]